jgi:hypothetical protein
MNTQQEEQMIDSLLIELLNEFGIEDLADLDTLRETHLPLSHQVQEHISSQKLN